jgi:hypothetical protein
MSKTIVHNLPNCQYGGLWWGSLARKLDMGFVDDSSYTGCPSYTTDETIERVNSGHSKLLLYWRWPMPELPSRQFVYNRQQHLLQSCDPNQVYVLDGDHMLDKSELDSRIKLLQPELALGDEATMYPYLSELELPYSFDGGRPLVYIGTPNGRLDQLKYFSKVDHELYGSWPSHLPNTYGKWPHDMVLDKYKGRVSMILAKKSYYESGYITPRFFELAYSNCAAILPHEYKQWVAGGELEEYVAANPTSVAELYELLSTDQSAHKANVTALRKWCKSIEGLAKWRDLLA